MVSDGVRIKPRPPGYGTMTPPTMGARGAGTKQFPVSRACSNEAPPAIARVSDNPVELLIMTTTTGNLFAGCRTSHRPIKISKQALVRL